MSNRLINLNIMSDRQYRPTEGDFIIRLALTASVSDLAEVLPLNLCLLIDQSSSMLDGDKMERAKEAAITLIESLQAGDILSIISFSTTVSVLADKILIAEEQKRNAINIIKSIDSGGVTRMDLGLEKAIEVLTQQKNDYMPVLLMLSDGGPTDEIGYLLSNEKMNNIRKIISDVYKNQGITTSTVGLGDASQCMAGFLEKLGEAGGGIFYHSQTAEMLKSQFMEELNRVKSTAISDVKFFISDIHGSIRKSVAISPDIRELEKPSIIDNLYVIEGGTLQKGENHVFLFEIITPSFKDTKKKLLCKVTMKYMTEGKYFETKGDDLLIEYTDDENLLSKKEHPEVEKYKSMYMAFIQTQKAVQNMRSGADPKKTQALLQSASKVTRRLGNTKQTKVLETLISKIDSNDVTENDLTATSVATRKTRVLKDD